jgi:hypothetical protein
MPIYPYSFTLPPVNKQDIPSDGVAGEFLGISAGGVLDWLPVSGGGGGGGDLLAANNLSELTPTAGTARTNLGLGTTDTPTFKNLVISTGSIATSAPVTISQTWADVAQTFKALVVNAAGSSAANSASGSLLLDLQTGGVSKITADKNGNISTAGNVYAAGVISGPYTYGAARFSGLDVYWDPNNAFYVNPFTGNIGLGPNTMLMWGAGIPRNNDGDVVLRRDGIAQLALRNGALAQTFRVYNTYTDASNYTRGQFEWSGGTFYVSTANAGTGVAAPLGFWVAGGERMRVLANGNVGIGTTAPTSNLTVAGTFNFGSTNGALPASTNYGGHLGSTQYFGLRSTSTVSTTLYLVNDSSGSKNAMVRLLGSGAGADHGGLDINTIESSPIIFTTGASSERMRISAAGNVGIGTTAPSSKLQVTGGDVEIETVTSGIIMKAAGTSTRYRITLNAGGTALVFTAI